jgi:glycosyltransferase involved in cell wall biosynthesis
MESNTLKKEGYDIFIICPKGKGYDKDYEKINDINIYRHPLPPEKSSALGYLREYSHALYYEWKLARRIYRENKFDVIQACNPPDFIFLVALWFKIFYRVKFVFDHHDLNPELYESKFNKRGFFYYFLKVAERLTFRSADMVMSTNESYKDVAITRGHVDKDKVHVVRSGPDLNIFNLKPPNNSYKKGRKYLVGYLGVMGEFDGVDHFIKAIGIIINDMKRKDIQFCLIGSGPCFEDLQRLSTDLEINEYVEFTGRISDEELLKRLSTCEVCVNADPLNPLNDKSTMNKILEYMALSKPIVQYDLVEGKRSAGEASLYAKPNDINDFANKIIELINDEDKRITMGRIGRRRMEEKLEWKHQSIKLINAYHNLFNQI